MAGTASAAPKAAAQSPDAAAGYSCTNWWKVYGSPHVGIQISCTGGYFTAWVDCYKSGYGTYRHFGNRVPSGGTSTVWCDVDGNPVAGGFTPS
ncbi:hypothetical protein ASE09_27640 [Streptomyces sp. Root66D1]|nr:hypothetical protein ASD33_30875 [Streptomyces sp. Root1304]KRA96378.1 hypothetical protein ASE09_27640 [Streptomyces sp. Root66D1]